MTTVTTLPNPPADDSMDVGESTPVINRGRPIREGIMSQRGGRGLPFRLDNIFLTIGAICLPTGIILILLGWYGSAHTGHIYEQNDYLISGGLLGLGLTFIGGFLYFANWMQSMVRATESGTQQTLRALTRLENKLGPEKTSQAEESDRPLSGVLVITEHGSMVNDALCPAVVGKSVQVVSRDEIGAYRPCDICSPLR
jgi:hypothetical protein